MAIKKFYLVLILVFFFCSKLTAQTKYDPSILILSPNKVEIQKSLKKEFQNLEEEIITRFKSELEYLQFNEEELTGPESFRLMYESQIELAKNMDFGNNFSFMIGNFMQYKFSELYPEYLVLNSIQESESDRTELYKTAVKNKVQYVISIPKIEIKKKDQKISSIRIILYDSIRNQIIIDKAFSGNEQNPGFTFACENGSINCTINNAASAILEEVLYVINYQSPYLKNQRIIASKRDSIIAEKFSGIKSNSYSLGIIQNYNPDLIIGELYQEIFNEDSTKFITVSIERNKAQNFQDFSKYYPTNLNILTEGREEEIIIDVFPNTYTQIIYGINYEGTWYVDISEATIFPAHTLESGGLWFLSKFLKTNNFFEDESTSLSSLFWESGLFEKVVDISQTEEYARYPEIYESELREDAPYIGKYKLVAKLQKNEQRDKLKEFEKRISSTIIEPLLERLKEDSIKDYTLLNNKELVLIYPSDTSFVLIPLSITDAKSDNNYLSYYLYDTTNTNFFRWTYFESIELSSSVYGSDIVDQLSTIIKWHFGFDFLDNQSFWQDFVFKKENGSYNYLEPVK